MQYLQTNSTLQDGKYRIIKELGQGGFGITYLAENTMLDGRVAIKEFFLKDYCERDSETDCVRVASQANQSVVDRYRQKFIKEAKTIFRLHHPNIIQIYDIFTENGTAYYVMEYVDGESLGDVVKQNGALSEPEAISFVKKISDALLYIHGLSINHLDVKPSNVMLRKSDGQVILIDFGVAKQYDLETREGTTTTPVSISPGYSPLEQYRSNGVQEFSPQSDVYSLAATMFKLLVGVTPPEAIEIQEEGLPIEELRAKGVSEKTIHAVEAAMQSRRKRTQSVIEFIKNLDVDVDESLMGKVILDKETRHVQVPSDGVDKYENAADLQNASQMRFVPFSREELAGDDDTMLLVEKPQQVTSDEKDFCLKYGLRQEGKEPIDLGLNVLWCSCNAGASSPASSGNFSEWIDLKPADVHDWRIPSTEEFKELKDKCNWKWIEEDEICGYLISSQVNDNKIFLRAAGKKDENRSISKNMGFYWSGSPVPLSPNAYCLFFLPWTRLCYIQNPCRMKMPLRFVISK